MDSHAEAFNNMIVMAITGAKEIVEVLHEEPEPTVFLLDDNDKIDLMVILGKINEFGETIRKVAGEGKAIAGVFLTPALAHDQESGESVTGLVVYGFYPAKNDRRLAMFEVKDKRVLSTNGAILPGLTEWFDLALIAREL